MPSNMAMSSGQGSYGWRWHNDDPMTADPLLICGLTGYADEAKIRGQLWDAMVITDSIGADITFAANSQNWWNITNAQPGSTQNARGAFCLLVP
jgi:hypothetical protein